MRSQSELGSGNAELPSAIQSLAVTERSGKMASAEQIHVGIHTCAVGQRAVHGIGLRAPVVRLHVEVQEIWVVVAAVQIGIPIEPHAVAGGPLVQVAAIVVSDIPAQTHAPVVSNFQLGSRGQNHQQRRYH